MTPEIPESQPSHNHEFRDKWDGGRGVPYPTPYYVGGWWDLGHTPTQPAPGIPKPESESADQRAGNDDDRSTCARCQFGGYARCPDGVPLPFDLRHRCSHHRARDAHAADARPAPVEPGGVGLVRVSEWLAFIDAVHAEDEAMGAARLMRGRP